MVWFFIYNNIGFGSKINPYEQCIANKLIDEHQYNIGWFVDNNKVSHMDDNGNSVIANKIEE